MKRESVYSVMFDTQRDRRYITWRVFVMAFNQKEAKEQARRLWHSDDNPVYKSRSKKRPYMFHTNAMRVTEDEVGGERINIFRKVYEKRATWG